MADRESAACRVCGSEPGEPCAFPDGPAPMVNDNGVQRRVVHAARYAASLPEEERAAFWEAAVERYLTTELALMNAPVVGAGETGQEVAA